MILIFFFILFYIFPYVLQYSCISFINRKKWDYKKKKNLLFYNSSIHAHSTPLPAPTHTHTHHCPIISTVSRLCPTNFHTEVISFTSTHCTHLLVNCNLFLTLGNPKRESPPLLPPPIVQSPTANEASQVSIPLAFGWVTLPSVERLTSLSFLNCGWSIGSTLGLSKRSWKI